MKSGDILRNLLEMNNISQKHAAKDLNIAVSSLSNYICNKREPDYETLKNIASYFNVTIDYLLNFRTTTTGPCHEKEMLLYIYRNLSEIEKKFFIEQGNLILRYHKKY